MRKYKIVTEATSDIPTEIVSKFPVMVLPMNYSLGQTEYRYHPESEYDSHGYYEQLKLGQKASTSQISVFDFEQVFKELYELGFDILYLGFSSALSGTFNNAVMANDNIKGEYPAQQFIGIDTLSASGGQGLLVYEALKLQVQGLEMEEVAGEIKALIHSKHYFFTVDDLSHLQRTGRLSNGQLFLGYLLKIKPLLHVDQQGRLVPLAKYRGRKSVMNGLFEQLKLGKLIIDDVFISHADCLEDALELKDRILEFNPSINVFISDIGPIIGSHTGPQALALFFHGVNE